MRKKKSLSHKVNNKEKKKLTITIYFLLRALVLISMLEQSLNRNWSNVTLCIFTLLLFTLPNMISSKLHITLPEPLEVIVYIFIFCASILGEIQNFYGIFTHWDTILHTLNGFICAAIGFSLVDILNNKEQIEIHLSPIFVALVAFSFSMTIGVIWEFIEYGADQYLEKDMQKDKIIRKFQSVKMNPNKKNTPIKIKNIEKTEIFIKNSDMSIIIENGYLDLGLHDTMKDLIVNFIGAIIFSMIGYLYIKNREEYRFIEILIPKIKKQE